MSHPHKAIFHGTAVFITASIEQGIMLPANPLVKFFVECCLAQAQRLFPVTVCHYCVNGTHLHLLAVVDNPEDIYGFMGLFKREMAHRLNLILGRRKRTIWCEGYDSPITLTFDKAPEYIAYLYTNPVKDNLIDSIDHSPNCSSWNDFRQAMALDASGVEQEIAKQRYFIHRPLVPKLGDHVPSLEEMERTVDDLKSKAKGRLKLVISPNAWMRCFGIAAKDLVKIRHINQGIIDVIHLEEQELRRSREKVGRSVMGAAALKEQWIDTTYLPNRTGKRTYCLSSNAQFRIRFLAWLKL